jgi:hypothetical protein
MILLFKYFRLEKIKASMESSHQEVTTQYQNDTNATVVQLFQCLHRAENRKRSLEKSLQAVLQRLEALKMSKTTREHQWRIRMQVILLYSGTHSVTYA